MEKRLPNPTRSPRLFAISDWVRAMLESHPPKLLFRGRNRRDYADWRRRFEAQYRKLLGRFPSRVPLRPDVIERRVFRAHILEKVVFDAEPCMSVPAWVCYPRMRRAGARLPAIVCCHGHGYGANMMVGLDPQGKKRVFTCFKDAAVRLAEEGYVTIAPEWRTFGERRESPARNPMGFDICNLGHLSVEFFGFNLLTLDVWDGMRTVDYLATRPEVDRRRIGCVGLSFGGTMSLFLAATDRRIRAACVSGYLGGTGAAIRHLATCGSQVLPGLLRWGDRAEVGGLICPRALLIQVGEYDSSFLSTDALRAYARLHAIYKAAGAIERLGLDRFEGCHEINFGPILAWFNRWIGSPFQTQCCFPG